MGSPPTVTGVLAVVFIFISSVFFLLIWSPVPADVVSRKVVLSCIWLWLCDRSARSSAKSRSSSCVQSVYSIQVGTCCCGLHDLVHDQEEEERWKQSPLPDSSLHLGTFRQLAGMGNSTVHVLEGAPNEGDYLLGDSIVSQSLPHCLSVYTVKGVLIIYEVDVEERGGGGGFHSSDCSTMLRRLAIWSAQDLFHRKSACWSRSLGSTASFILSSRTLLRTLHGVDRSMIPR